VTVTPPSGAVLTVRDCGPSRSGIPGSHLCSDDWRGTFDLVLGRHLSEVVMTVTFEGTAGRCGIIYVPGLTFAADREQRVSTASALFATHETEGPGDSAIVQDCRFPATTTRLVVQLWDPGGGVGSAAMPLLRREFEYIYTFTADEQATNRWPSEGHSSS